MVMYAVVDTHPCDRASNMMEASSLVRPVPPKSDDVYRAPNPSWAAFLRTSTGKMCCWSQVDMWGNISFMAKLRAMLCISFCSSVRPADMSSEVTNAGVSVDMVQIGRAHV